MILDGSEMILEGFESILEASGMIFAVFCDRAGSKISQRHTSEKRSPPLTYFWHDLGWFRDDFGRFCIDFESFGDIFAVFCDRAAPKISQRRTSEKISPPLTYFWHDLGCF